ncbi:helix-turn-helix domain-containing protein [Pseudobutyrivibrio xylanivorans]|uniref:DNA-binding transcriptional regulator, XRE family n=1 Tax=Pseudobutyrivibrio xylanivorans TaxID=185007 RepID=A0A1G5RTT0_PSEXY|nr:helix-turn-helix transcriptional regulator [Pseudobutyrivibrio xylanivorans]SCZ77406.1 DNA-binding transcriptional regulator, XRE family [Pseudobutyrivibrio xylanivorans]
MEVSYKKLWKLLIDKDLMKKDLQSNAGISWATITKMSKGGAVSTDVLMRICKYLQCDVGDIVEFIDAEKSEEKTK